jgi:hypothetical protein
MVSSDVDRVRAHTRPEELRRLDEEAFERLERLAAGDGGAIEARLAELEREWDVERWLETNGSLLGAAGLALGVARDRRFLLLTGAVLGFCLQHALQGWCPPLAAFRRLGVRTRREIDAEKFALKALRGDFEDARDGPEAAVAAVRA